MNGLLAQLVGGTRGGTNRARIIVTLRAEPMNAHALASTLEVDYKTVTYHLRILEKHGFVEPESEGYGKPWAVAGWLIGHHEELDALGRYLVEQAAANLRAEVKREAAAKARAAREARRGVSGGI